MTPAQVGAGRVPAGTDTALGQRVRAVAAVLLPAGVAASPEQQRAADETAWTAHLLDELARSLKADPDPARMWLLYTAVSTVMPRAEELRAALRVFARLDPDAALHWLLESCLGAALDLGTPGAPITIVRDAVLVEVDFSARNNVHTGIQRVVRALLPHWDEQHEILPVAWTPAYGALRELTASEADRALRWHGGPARERSYAGLRATSGSTLPDSSTTAVLVPWRSTLVLAEVPARAACDRLAALAEFSSTAVSAIGYDCIPVISAELLPLAEPRRFVHYLSVVKHMKQVAAISASASAEFQGFAHMLRAQGLAGPKVFECALPSEPVAAGSREAEAGEPLVLSVGSLEPRKNHLALLYAAETLWREGHRFRLQLIAGGGAGRQTPAMIKRLARAGRPVTALRAVSDAQLHEAYRSARFSVFASLHEGYGLPVAESLAFGTPVITSNFGSTKEIGEQGGTVLVDPRVDAELVAAMRELLCDDELIARLRAEIPSRATRTWQDYADELWQALVVAQDAEWPEPVRGPETAAV